MKTIYARKYGDTKRIGLRYARRRNQPQIPQIVVFFEAFVICVRVFTFIRAKRVSNCCIQTKNLRECSSNVGVSEVRIMYQIRMYHTCRCTINSTAVSLFVYSLVGGGITRTFRPWTHTSEDSYIYQLSLVVATATVSLAP